MLSSKANPSRSHPFKPFVSLKNLNRESYLELFKVARSLSLTQLEPTQKHSAALLFFEPSTRTRLSFDLALKAEGFATIVIESGAGSSIEKGETLEDTLYNIAAMGVDILVVRANESFPYLEIANQVRQPILCGGWGKRAHPTQAMLDALTLQEIAPDFRDLRLLFVGDVLHSRVFSSHRELSQILGYEIAVCGPAGMTPSSEVCPKQFLTLSEGLKWSTAVMALRYQKERHSGSYSFAEIKEQYSLNAQALAQLDAQGLILHPGPIEFGLETERETLQDPRCRIWQQVENGVRVRRALVRAVRAQL